ncbi:MAG: hypothetical protein IPI01_15790 [Ignavibacteriae bacterium]|nr:hypothetical protein [Ignavibacteriota bacterium]
MTDNTVDDRVTSLQENLSALLDGRATRQQVDAVIAVCHALALTHVRSKRSAWRMMEFHGVSHADLAYDCIAELFRRDDAGVFTDLQAFFKDLSPGTADSAEILVHLRRLVFAKTNRTLSRLIADTDSLFFRITRNVRLAASMSGLFEETERFGETLLVPAGIDPQYHLPYLADARLAQVVWNAYSLSALIPVFMSRLHEALAGVHDACRVIPLMPVVLLIKEVHEGHYAHRESAVRPDALAEDAALEIVAVARRETGERFQREYVGKGKVTLEEFTAYLNAIQSILVTRIAEDAGNELSLFSALKGELGDVAEECYKRMHRSRIEYMARYMHQRVAEHLK